jgi:hypothetical protein
MNRLLLSCGAACLLLWACNNFTSTPTTGGLGGPGTGGGSGSGSGNSDGGADGGTDGGADLSQHPASTSQQDLITFVKAGAYKSWKAETAIHDSLGPHENRVLVYMNAQLYGSVKSGAAVHPVGSVAVKELYASTGTNIIGHALMVKESTSAGTQWVFFEGSAPSYNSPSYFKGIANFCYGCHHATTDSILTQGNQLP